MDNNYYVLQGLVKRPLDSEWRLGKSYSIWESIRAENTYGAAYDLYRVLKGTQGKYCAYRIETVERCQHAPMAELADAPDLKSGS